MLRNHGVANDTAGDQVFLDDPFEHRRIARRVPHALGIDDGDRSALADAQAVGFRSENAALLGEAELLQPALEEFPRRETALFLAAFRIRLIAAEEDVTPRGVDADRLRDRALRVGGHQPSAFSPTLRTRRGPIRDRARLAAPCSRRARRRRRPRGWRGSL